jgi:hypothetical protein
MHKISLKIADVVIRMQSRYPLQKPTEEEKKRMVSERFDNFTYKGSGKPDILIDIDITGNLPQVKNTKPVFITYHFQDGKENWRLLKKGGKYIYKSPLDNKKQLMRVNKSFDRVDAYLLSKSRGGAYDKESKDFVKKNKGLVWNTGDVIYDFLQVLLINYFAQRNEGIFTHSVGIKDTGGNGLLFSGKSGAGKSTTARIWHKNSKAMVLNDDRIIVRKIKDKFFIHGCPWHGDFNDYLESRIESAPLEKMFFIHHAPKNTARKLSQKEAFSLLYPSLFPTFWDKKCLGNIATFCVDLISKVPCYSMGFVNDKKIIEFVRNVK